MVEAKRARAKHEARTIKLTCWPADGEQWPLLRMWVNLAQTVARKLFARLELLAIDAATPDASGGVKPGKRADLFSYAEMMELAKQMAGHELPTATLDLIVHYVQGQWTAKDAETKCSRGYLAMNSRRRRPLFRYMPLPLRVCQSDRLLFEVSPGCHEFVIRMAKDAEAGERKSLTLKIGTTDPQSWRLWKGMVEQRWRICDSAKLRMRAGPRGDRLELIVAYRVSTKKATVDPARVLELAWDNKPESLWRATLREGHTRTFDSRLSHTEAAGELPRILSRLAMAQEAIEKRIEMASAGSSFKAKDWLREHQGRFTAARDSVLKHYNHVWTKKVAELAIKWLCGSVLVVGIPERLLGHTWQWANFRFDLEYKAREIGVTVKYDKGADIAKEVAGA